MGRLAPKPEPRDGIWNCAECGHPLTAHTGTADTWPWKICAHLDCGCQLLI